VWPIGIAPAARIPDGRGFDCRVGGRECLDPVGRRRISQVDSLDREWDTERRAAYRRSPFGATEGRCGEGKWLVEYPAKNYLIADRELNQSFFWCQAVCPLFSVALYAV
jgi:hypothetical protein